MVTCDRVRAKEFDETENHAALSEGPSGLDPFSDHSLTWSQPGV